jgi:DNA-binding response OmpR family regulator
MIYKTGGVVLLISKDRKLKQLFYEITKNFNNTQLVIYSNLKSTVLHRCVKVIFFDISLFESTKVKCYLKELESNYIGIPIFLIVQEDSHNKTFNNPIENLVNYGAHLVLPKPIKRITVRSILMKNIVSLRDRQFDFRKYHGLILNEKYQYAIYNECKIFLSQTECLLLSILMQEDCIMKCSEIMKAMGNKSGQYVSENSLRVCISRVKRKFKNSVGFSIIGNKHGVGYFITI